VAGFTERETGVRCCPGTKTAGWVVAAALLAGCATAVRAPARSDVPAGTVGAGSVATICARQAARASGRNVPAIVRAAGLAAAYFAVLGAAQGAWSGAISGGSAGQGAWIGAAIGAGVGGVAGLAVGLREGAPDHQRYRVADEQCREHGAARPDGAQR
jgi:hypothetical protein